MISESIKLHIAVPSHGMVCLEFTHSVVGLVAKLSCGIPTRPNSELQVSFTPCKSPCIHGGRESLVELAIEADASHILFLDHDMSFDPRVIDVLFSRRQSVVVTNYVMKKEDPVEFVAVGLDGKRAATVESSTGLEEIVYSGFGVSLFEVRAFKDTPQPWFLPQWVADSKQYTTEDNPCFQKLRAHGHKCWLDHDASKLVAHNGDKAYDWRMYGGNK